MLRVIVKRKTRQHCGAQVFFLVQTTKERKMEGLGQLTVFSIVMLVGSYGAGSAPLFMPMSEEKLHLVSVLGAGLLVGVAFAVIIPEGVLTLIKAYSLRSQHKSLQLGNDDNKATSHIEEDHHHGEDHSFEGLDRLMGISLVLGFIFMMFVDQLASSMSSNRSSLPTTTDEESSRRRSKTTVNWTTTLGLVVHAAADGIAMGAAAATNQVDVEIIVFLAIMLHKAPAAFGLVTFLLHEGLDRNRTRKHLLIFSVSAPSLALLTFISLAWTGSNEAGKVPFNNSLLLTFIFTLLSFPV